MSEKKANIRDVARVAGVSITTTSQILKGVGRYSDDTIKKVWKVVNELNYTPNPYVQKIFAGENAQRKEHRLLMRITHCPFNAGFFNPDGHEPLRMFYFEHACQENDYAGTNYIYRHVHGFRSHLLLNDMVDGVVLGVAGRDIIANIRSRIPAVLTDINVTPERVGLPVVNADLIGGYSHALQVMQKAGIKGKMAVVYGTNAEMEQHSIMGTGDIASKMFRATEQCGINIEQKHRIKLDITAETDETIREQLADRLVEMIRHEKVKIIGIRNICSLKALTNSLKKRGIRLPEDAVLLCVAEMPVMERGIAAVTYDWEKMMETAVHVLIREIRSKEKNVCEHIVPCGPFNENFLK